MPHDHHFSIRTTQRAPRSCVPCSSRKIKCDKSIPCSTCIRRGRQGLCVRELVLVRGEITAYRDDPQLPTYEDLKRENERLKQAIESLKASQATSYLHLLPTSDIDQHVIESSRHQQWNRIIDEDQDGLERELWNSLASEPRSVDAQVTTWNDIVLPNQSLSNFLIDYDEKWNSWVHYALEYPRFRHECDDFTTAMANGSSLAQMDPFWLAVYFSVLSAALLMMDDDTAKELPAHESIPQHTLSRNWYNAALFCLHQAGFIQVPSIRSVQAIAVLGICFNNFGESESGSHLWACAIFIAKRIGLYSSISTADVEQLSEEAQHRLWWTIVICEWLRHPWRPPAIDEFDFDVPYPKAPTMSVSADTGQIQEHPVHYHIFMARASKVYHRFCKAVRISISSLESMIQIVRLADEELASIIDTLPEHLQPDADISNLKKTKHHTGSTEGWITWQRFDLTLVLLHLRIRINRTLQVHWLSTPVRRNTDWARTISLTSAISIIWIHKNWNQPSSMRKQWYVNNRLLNVMGRLALSYHSTHLDRALSYHIFTAALVLLREWQNNNVGHQKEHRDGVCAALDILDQVRPRNALAHHAFLVLRERMNQIRS